VNGLVPLRTGGRGTPLFCVHPSSGSAYVYAGLAQSLGDDRPVYGIEAPGLDDDRPPVRSLPALADEYASSIRAFAPGDGLLMLGWSLGGIIAVETARRLAPTIPVRHVVLVDVSVPYVAPPPPEQEIVRRFLHDLLATAPPELPALATGGAILRALEEAGALPEDLDADLLTDRYEIFRANVEASYGHAVTEPYAGPVTHLIAEESQGPHMRWGSVLPTLTEHVLPGDHHSIWRGDGLLRLATLTREALSAHQPTRPAAQRQLSR
jgi:thioesterase domain-containing protein